jgi:site-specific recombinase XerD
MSPLRGGLETYLALRRALGTELRDPGARLHRFVEYLEREGVGVITAELALRWATAPGGVSSVTWAQRLGDVRRFATWLSAEDPRTEIPSSALLPERWRRRQPYIYSDEEVARILRETARLPSPLGLRSRTYETLFGLLATTGLRLGEALGLDRDDVDLRSGILAIRRAKFGKSRFVPVHSSTRRVLRRYVRQRDLLLPRPTSPAFLISERGTRITHSIAEHTFAVVSRSVGLRASTGCRRRGHGPRLHDMRHRLAVKVLIRWYRQGRDVERELSKLSTYLGHVHVADTYWYLEAVPELLRLATERATSSSQKETQ